LAAMEGEEGCAAELGRRRHREGGGGPMLEPGAGRRVAMGRTPLPQEEVEGEGRAPRGEATCRGESAGALRHRRRAEGATDGREGRAWGGLQLPAAEIDL
jgi:hypothetical protein